jgi:hypothetical protein
MKKHIRETSRGNLSRRVSFLPVALISTSGSEMLVTSCPHITMVFAQTQAYIAKSYELILNSDMVDKTELYRKISMAKLPEESNKKLSEFYYSFTASEGSAVECFNSIKVHFIFYMPTIPNAAYSEMGYTGECRLNHIASSRGLLGCDAV